jgi:hypothetical protein
MDIDSTPRKGPIEGTSRVLRELLRTPRFKASVRIIIRDMDPENAALLVRTLMFEDPEFFLSLVAMVPALVNASIAGMEEMASQASTFPPPVLTGFMAGIVEEVDARRLGRTAGQMLALGARLSAERDEALSSATKSFWAGVGAGISDSLPSGTEVGDGATGLLLDTLMPMLGSVVARLGAQAVKDGSEARQLIKGIADSIRAIASENPEFMKEVVVPLVDAGRDAIAQVEGGPPESAEGDK